MATATMKRRKRKPANVDSWSDGRAWKLINETFDAKQLAAVDTNQGPLADRFDALDAAIDLAFQLKSMQALRAALDQYVAAIREHSNNQEHATMGDEKHGQHIDR